MIATALLLLGLCLSTSPQADEELRMVHMLVNGDFSMAPEEVVPGAIPWWIRKGPATRVEARGDSHWLVTEQGSYALQPIPAYAPLVDQLLIKGRVEGIGRVTIIDGRGEPASLEVGRQGEITDFEWSGSEIAEVLGHTPLPRLNLALDAPQGKASWSNLSVQAAFPCPTESALRKEIVECLHDTLDPWVERSVDNFGTRNTGLFCSVFDAITGESIYIGDAGFHPLADNLMEALEFEPDANWERALDRYIADFLELCLHPETGLPRQWDAQRDVPLDKKYIEIHVALRFLLDVYQRGPEAYREKALIAAKKVGASALRKGALPDGNVAALYRPADGAASNATRMLRRLDMPAQLARLAAITEDKELLDSARASVATVLYTHYWPGSWNRIDPGFDDDFGHYGARAGTMASQFPKEPLFRRMIDTGWAKYRVLWRQSLKFGGSMAADQVRCWKLLLAYSELRPELREDLDDLLLGAVHSHLRGQQYGSGAWGDVTYYGFQPVVDLQVGDLPGTPSNLLEGLAMVYGTGLGHSDEDLRALFTGVLRSSIEIYGREYGLITSMREIDGANNAGGSIRIAPALTMLLRKLSGDR